MVDLPKQPGLPDNVFMTKLDAAANWARSNSLWPMPFATACCGIELMATASSRFDLARFGAEVMRFSPRQCDLMIVAGRVVMKMLPVLQRIWLQMPEPKWCISMGACACTGGVFDTYAVVQGVDRFIPVDLYVPVASVRLANSRPSWVPVFMTFSCRSMIPRSNCSGRGGQPGTYISTGMKRSTPCTTA